MATRKRVDSWVVTDDFWERIEPLIPVRERPATKEYMRKAGAGRPHIAAAIIAFRKVKLTANIIYG